MTDLDDNQRLQRQVTDAATRLKRTSGAPVVVLALQEMEGGMGVAYAVDGHRMAQLELGYFMLLQKLEADLMEGAAEGCETCTAAWRRVSGAVAALAPGFGAGGETADMKGRC